MQVVLSATLIASVTIVVELKQNLVCKDQSKPFNVRTSLTRIEPAYVIFVL